jgi:hypothetical protein
MRRRRLNESDDSFDGLLDVVSETFDGSLARDSDTDVEVTIDLGDYETTGAAKDDAIRIAKNTIPWVADLDEKRGLIGVEAPLHTLGLVSNPWPFKMLAYADALYGDDTMYASGSDLKTSRDQRPPEKLTALQMGIYDTFVHVPWFVDVVPKFSSVLPKAPRSPNPRSYVCSLTPDNQRYVRNLVMEVAGRIRDGDFPARPGYTCKFDHGDPEFKLAVTGFGD